MNSGHAYTGINAATKGNEEALTTVVGTVHKTQSSVRKAGSTADYTASVFYTKGQETNIHVLDHICKKKPSMSE